MATQQPMDALESFRYVVENVPVWISQITDLSNSTAQKHNEFAAEYIRLVKHIRPRRTKSPSMASIRSPGEDEGQNVAHSSSQRNMSAAGSNQPSTTATPRLHIDPLEAGNKYLYAQAQRKRKSDNSVQSAASGPQKFRTKAQVVIYYDGNVQQQFDSMVKAIGRARNNLRKGKNALTVAKGFQLPSLGRRYDSPSALSALDDIRPMPMLKPSPPLLGSKYGSFRQRQAPSDDEAAFVETDKVLESVQSLCETAAHQFLRDGDCKTELDAIFQGLASVLTQARSATEALQNQKEQNEDVDMEDEDITNIDTVDSSETTLSSLSDSRHPELHHHKLLPTFSTYHDHGHMHSLSNDAFIPADIPHKPLTGMEIEVDDENSEVSSVLVDISKYRLGNPVRFRA